MQGRTEILLKQMCTYEMKLLVKHSSYHGMHFESKQHAAKRLLLMETFDNDYAINHITYKGQSGCNIHYYCRRLECMLASPSGEFCDRIVRGCVL